MIKYFLPSLIALSLLLSVTIASAQTSSSGQKTSSASTTPTTTKTVVEKKTSSKKNNRGPISSEIGLNIPEWGISIDAIFNPELDDLIPGYHILNVVLTNRRAERIDLSSSVDKWIITDQKGRKHTASNHVANFDKKLWEQLPQKLQKLLDYPPSVSAGKSVKIDIFISKSVPLHNFKELAWHSKFFDRTFNVYTSYEDKIVTPNEKEFDTKNDTTSLEPEFDLNNLPEDVPAEEESESTPSKFDQQTMPTMEQPPEQTIVIH